jgi:hypothetical protein
MVNCCNFIYLFIYKKRKEEILQDKYKRWNLLLQLKLSIIFKQIKKKERKKEEEYRKFLNETRKMKTF